MNSLEKMKAQYYYRPQLGLHRGTWTLYKHNFWPPLYFTVPHRFTWTAHSAYGVHLDSSGTS